MECSCDMSIDMCDSEVFKISHNKIVTAKKTHKCNECGHEIQPGKQYENYSGLYEGHWWHHKTCLDCLDIRNTFFKKGFYAEMLYENLSENLDEWGCDIPEDCIADLRPRAREKVCELIEKCWSWLDKD